MGAVLPPLEAYCWNFSSVRSFLVSFIALWMLSIVLNSCPRGQFVILGKGKKSHVGDIRGILGLWNHCSMFGHQYLAHRRHITTGRIVMVH